MEKNSNEGYFCELHPTKQYEFFCYAHSSFCCSLCICHHVDCQVKGQFSALELIHQKYISSKEIITNEFYKKNKQILESEMLIQDKITILEGLEQADLSSIEIFFEEMKKKTEKLKSAAITNYKKNFNIIVEKIKKKRVGIENTIKNYKNLENRLQKMNEEMSLLQDLKEKQYNSIYLDKQLSEIRLELTQKPFFYDLSEEIDVLLNKEEVFSELGQLTQSFGSLETKILVFIKEHFADMINKGMKDNLDIESPLDLENRRKLLDFNEDIVQTLDGSIFDMKNEKTLIHQLRCVSNEVYIYDTDKNVFSEYFLFHSKDYDDPFQIFNNCCSVIVKNHLVFMFGGEDIENNDKSSKRAFCFNISTKTKDNKVVVYELEEMLNARQETTLTLIGNYVYLISGYNSNLYKDKRVISKCEKFDLKTKKFYEIRDINYPRQASSCTNIDNNHIYVFGGYNPNYMNQYVDKIEKFIIKLNDWVVLKFNILDSVDYLPGMKSACFRMNETDIIILGGNRNGNYNSDYYIFDIKKLVLIKKCDKNLIKEQDEFNNQNNLYFNNNLGFIFSGNFANRVYKVTNNEEKNSLNIEIISKKD